MLYNAICSSGDSSWNNQDRCVRSRAPQDNTVCMASKRPQFKRITCVCDFVVCLHLLTSTHMSQAACGYYIRVVFDRCLATTFIVMKQNTIPHLWLSFSNSDLPSPDLQHKCEKTHISLQNAIMSRKCNCKPSNAKKHGPQTCKTASSQAKLKNQHSPNLLISALR